MKEEQLLNDVAEYKKIFIYGAGMVGGLVLKRFIKYGINPDCINFVVSEAFFGQSYLGHTVYDIRELKKISGDYKIIVSTLKKNQPQIIDNLERMEITDYIVVDEELYDDMEENYVEEFLKTKKINSDDIDILFMASDNNSSSGAFLCLVDINKELIKRGIKSLVVLPMYGNGEQLLIDNNIEYTYVLSKDWLIEQKNIPRKSLNKNEKAIQVLKKLIEQHHIKLVHNNTTYTYVGAVAALQKKIPFIWHIREFIKEQGLWFIDEAWSYDLINNSEYIIPVSEYVGSCYEGFCKEKIKRIYDGVDVDKYYSEHQLFQNSTLKILMPGNIVPLKGQEQLVRAAIELKKQGMDFEISFIGSGDASYIAGLKEIVENSELASSIRFFDRSPELEKWYQQSDIVVVCSRAEAFGRVTVEAQLSGCIVIGAKCGATVELIEDNRTGLLYELNNDKMLAEKIIFACKHKEKMREIALNGQKFAAESYNKADNAKEIVALYKEIVDF